MVIESLKHNMKVVSVFTLVVLISYSCVGCSSDDEKINREIEDLLTITQGIYGQATSYDDVGDNPVRYNPGFRIEVFDQIPSFDPADGIEPLQSVVAGERGFYEIELETGSYCVCTTFRRCLSADIFESELLRLDYEFSAGPGWSFDPMEDNVDLGCIAG